MLKKLNNSFSISIQELINKILSDYNEIYIDNKLEKIINQTKEYLNDDKLYDEWVLVIEEQIHLTIPQEIKDKCEVCKGNSKLIEDMACESFYESADEEYHLFLIIHVYFININKALFQSKELIKELTIEFFKNFEFSEGKLIFNAKQYDDIMLTNVLLLLRELFAGLETHAAIKEINKSIEELETHKIIATSTNRVLFDIVKPQLKFLKSQLKHYQKKLLTESIPNSADYKNDDDIYKDYTNIFHKSMPIKTAVNHFTIFTISKSKNGKPFLTKDQLDIFIRKAFCGISDLPKQTFNQIPKGEKFKIQYVFREFYNNYFQYFNTGQVQDEFIKLLTENFTGWEFKNIKNNFNLKSKKTI